MRVTNLSTKHLLRSVVLVATLAMIGCVGELETLEGSGGGGGGGGGGVDAGGTTNAAAQTYYTNNVRPLLIAARPKGACNVCHEGANLADGPDFMGAASGENYAALVGNTRMVSGDPATSQLILRGDHSGDAFCTGAGAPYAQCIENEVGILTTWINLVGTN